MAIKTRVQKWWRREVWARRKFREPSRFGSWLKHRHGRPCADDDCVDCYPF